MGSECLEVEVPSFDDSSVQGRQRDAGGHRFSSALMVIRAGMERKPDTITIVFQHLKFKAL